MKDPRLAQLAEQLVTYSVGLEAGEKIYLEIKGTDALNLGRELVRVSAEKGGVPFWYYNDEDVSRGFIKHANEKQFASWGKFHRRIMEDVVLQDVAAREAEQIFDPGGSLDMKESVERLETALIKAALTRTGGNQSVASRLLGVSRFGLIKKMTRFGLK